MNSQSWKKVEQVD